jgi:Skp family chaperone for outer membrane proteins
MKVIGTALFAIFLMVSSTVTVNAQTVTQPTTAPKVITESDLRKATTGLSKEMKRNTAELKAEFARQAKAQAEMQQRAVEKAASDRRDADQKTEDARRAEAQADAKLRGRVSLICVSLAIAIVGFVVFALRKKSTQNATRLSAEPATTVNATPATSPIPEDLYGLHPSPSQVKKCLLDHKLREACFTIDLPNDGLVFEYRAVVDSEGIVTARFAGNGDTVTALDHLRKTAKKLYDCGNGPLRPITLKAIGIRLVS